MNIIKYNKISNNFGYTLSIFNNFFYSFWDGKCLWFRFFSKYGLHLLHRNAKSYIPFSERMGYKKQIKIFGWAITFLK